jgi:hypothetical protein
MSEALHNFLQLLVTSSIIGQNIILSSLLSNILNLSRSYMVLTMVYNTQRYWVFGLCPSSGFFLNNNEKHNVSETGYYSLKLC